MSDKITYTPHQYTSTTVIEINPACFAKSKVIPVVTLPTGSVIIGGYLAVIEAFPDGNIKVGDKANTETLIASKALNASSVTGLKVDGQVFNGTIYIESDATPTSKQGKARLIVNYCGMDKQDWSIKLEDTK